MKSARVAEVPAGHQLKHWVPRGAEGSYKF